MSLRSPHNSHVIYARHTHVLFHSSRITKHPGSTTKVFGIVNSHTEFKHQHLVMDGCSDLIMEVFDKPVGYHARSAIGTNTLPLNAPVEVEAIVKIRPE